VGRHLAVPLLAAALLVLPGCFYLPPVGGVSGGSSDEASAESNVRTAIPAIEAYHADNGTYAGMTVEGLRATYDAGIGDVALVGPLSREAYCVESTVGEVTYAKPGPAAQIAPGPCGALVPLAPAHTDAEDAVLAAVPLLQAYREEHGSYTGVDRVSEVYGAPLGDVRVVVRKRGRAYCIEAPSSGPSAHFDGPRGALASGPCA
jgi:hypothetical protein